MKGSDYSRIEKAIHFLVKNAEKQPSLKDLSDFLGLSESHFHRLFRKWAGITPKDFLQLIALSKAKALLPDSGNIFDVSLGAGLSGSSRLHDLFIRYEAMTPGDYKAGGAGIEVNWDVFESPLGKMVIGATSRGICALSFVKNDRQGVTYLKATWPKANFVRDKKALQPISKEIVSWIKGRKTKPLSLLLKGTPFQVKVWEALLRIPEGKVTTYQEIAKSIGSPKATRAVGTAIGANPIGYLIPCHRVIRSTGAIGDYHWGSDRKTALLAIEHGR